MTRLMLLMLAITACATDERAADAASPTRLVDSATAAEGVATGFSREARFDRNVVGFQGPESVRYDPELDVFFVSNQTGPGSQRDGNGYIVRMSAEDPTQTALLAQGGRGGVVLDSPKGLALHGDTLWTADIDKLRAFDRRTGTPLATIDFAPLGAVQLNDVAIGPDGTIHVTDTGIIMSRKGVIHTGPDRIFVVGPGRAIRVMAEGPQLKQPNGITWDPIGKRWIVVSFDPYHGEVAAMWDGSTNRQPLWASTHGNFDGVEVLHDGSILYASWADSSIHVLEGGADRQLIRAVPEPADIGIDTRRNRLAIPLATLDRVQLWNLGSLGRGESLLREP
jgi:sugar lactone lactonase YvrE